MSYTIACIGAGAIAVQHLQAIREVDRLTPVAIADPNETRAQEVAAEYGIRSYSDYRTMIDHESPRIVIVAVPHFLHKECALYAAECGCAVLLEKPMALNTEECDEIIEAAQRNSAVMLVGHTQHYIAENRKAKQLIDSGVLGELVMIQDTRNMNYFSPSRPDWFYRKALAGGGILANLGSHSIDKVQWLGGSRVKKVRASLTFHADRGDVEGSGLIFIENEAGVPAAIMQSGYLGAPRNETELSFTGGSIKLQTSRGLWVSKGGSAYEPIEPDPQPSPFIMQLLDLLACIETGQEPECSLAYSRSIVAVVDSLYLSHRYGTELTVPV
ncbi:Gfo/Idh/MocA family protein [Cohnella rhizosphaerae]|uniref:Gfo/Idh/MocA family oxidoreductase n=1 Tax=Cohnella rhizosphaerae TaxID=1457232 RepID=A0A9X4KUA9_9BACL|nr:Gfo/Idh/MocA family oxidoreductase [Cohnella rhizosphaerae]MDG0810391.1 Gfo/Idh/MocA family oxidoreductase [Cohnella rhizosphaerae]